jgi:hypothetical protein
VTIRNHFHISFDVKSFVYPRLVPFVCGNIERNIYLFLVHLMILSVSLIILYIVIG